MTHSIFKSLIITFAFLLSGLAVQSQTESVEAKEKAIYDSLTFYYYNISEWDSVIDIGKEALYKGHDFYYLRMRIGMAYDYQSNFRLAEKHYSEALKLVPTDVNAAYYMYYAAVNGGRKDVGYKQFQSFTDDQKLPITKGQYKKMKYLYEEHQYTKARNVRTKAFEQLYFAYGYSFTGNDGKLADMYPNEGNIKYSEGNIRYNQSYFSLSLKGNLAPLIQWNLAYNNSKINAVKLFQARGESHLSVPITVKQNELYTAVGVSSGTGWNLKLSGQLLHYNTNLVTIHGDTSSYEIPESQDSMLIETNQYVYTDDLIKGSDYVLGLVLSKKMGLMDFSIFGSYASIVDKNPMQFGGELTVLPRGNYSLYLTNRVFFYHDISTDKFIYKVTAGASLTKKINLEAAATFGDLQFTNEPGISVVYNWSEKTTFKGDFVLSYQLKDKIYLSIRYQLSQKQSLYSYQTVDEILESPTYPGYYYSVYREEEGFYKFNQHFIIVGFTWGF